MLCIYCNCCLVSDFKLFYMRLFSVQFLCLFIETNKKNLLLLSEDPHVLVSETALRNSTQQKHMLCKELNHFDKNSEIQYAEMRKLVCCWNVQSNLGIDVNIFFLLRHHSTEQRSIIIFIFWLKNICLIFSRPAMISWLISKMTQDKWQLFWKYNYQRKKKLLLYFLNKRQNIYWFHLPKYDAVFFNFLW